MQQMQGYGWGPPPQLAQPGGRLRRMAVVLAAVLVAAFFILSNLGLPGLVAVGLASVLWLLWGNRRAVKQGGRALVEYGVAAALALALAALPNLTLTLPDWLTHPPSVESSRQTITESVGDFWQKVQTNQPTGRGGGR